MFTSRRERRYWILASVVTLAIWATLGLARSLSDVIRDRDLADALFVTGFFLVVGALIVVGLRSKPSWAEVGVGIAVAGAYVMVISRLAIPEERTHLFEYGVVAVLIYLALLERRNNGRTVRIPALKAIVVTSLIGWIDEVIQSFLPDRVYDIRDVGFNALAAAMAVASVAALSWARARFGRGRADNSA